MKIVLGSDTFYCQNAIVFDEEVLLGFSPPLLPGEPFSIQARLFDSGGKELFVIRDNVLEKTTEHFDFEVEANAITVREGPNMIAIKLRITSEREIIVERLRMKHHMFQFDIDQKKHSTRLEWRDEAGQLGSVLFGANTVYATDGIVLSSKTQFFLREPVFRGVSFGRTRRISSITDASDNF